MIILNRSLERPLLSHLNLKLLKVNWKCFFPSKTEPWEHLRAAQTNPSVLTEKRGVRLLQNMGSEISMALIQPCYRTGKKISLTYWAVSLIQRREASACCVTRPGLSVTDKTTSRSSHSQPNWYKICPLVGMQFLQGVHLSTALVRLGYALEGGRRDDVTIRWLSSQRQSGRDWSGQAREGSVSNEWVGILQPRRDERTMWAKCKTMWAITAVEHTVFEGLILPSSSITDTSDTPN